MSKKSAAPRIFAFDQKGREREIKAAWLEIDFGKTGRFRLVADPTEGGTLVVGAQAAEAGFARLNLLPLGPDAVELRVSATESDDGDLDDDVWLDGPESMAPLLNLSIQKAVEGADKAASPRKCEIRRWASAALRAGVANVTVRLVGEAEGRELNRDFRGKDYPTNVLSFAYEDDVADTGDAGDGPWSGDLVICVPVVVREAAEQGKPTEAHFAHLVVHGMLHLQGLDHEDAEQADVMEALETEVLAALGFDDPYVECVDEKGQDLGSPGPQLRT